MNLRAIALVVVTLSAATACGGKKDGADQNKLLDELAQCKDDRDRAKNAADACTKQFAEYKALTPTGPQEILVRIDGEGLTIVGKLGSSKPGEAQVGSGDLTEAEKNVVPLVIAQIAGSRTAIQQCYVQALKTNTGLEGRAVNLTIQVKVSPSGGITGASFSPQLSPQFDTCMSTVAGRWKISPYQGRAFPLQYPIKLQPVN
jgi:hypothetical protein